MTRHSALRSACLFSGLGLTLALTTPTAALAYYPCNGPGPGEVLIGVDNTNGVQTPLCEYVGEDGDGGDYGGGDGGGGYADPGGYWAENFASVVWGIDDAGNPSYTWYANAVTEAEADNGAMAECHQAGFSDCRLGPAVANGSVAIAVGKDGSLYGDWGADARTAKRKALSLCKASAKGCKIEKVLDSPSVWISY